MNKMRYILSLTANHEFINENAGGVANKILCEFIERPVLSTYQCYKNLNENYKQVQKTISYKNVHKRIKKLHSFGLIKIKQTNKNESYHGIGSDNSTSNKHGAIYYTLTSFGIFYLLKNHLADPKKIITEYKNDGIYENFLYPFLDFRTIKKIDDDHIIYKIIDYLGNCCILLSKLVQQIIDMEKQGGYSHFLGFIDTFADPIHYDDPNYGAIRCIKYLKDKSDIPWLDIIDIKILEIEKNKIFKICRGKNELILRLYPEKKKAILSEGDNEISKFSLRKLENGSYEIYDYKVLSSSEYLNESFQKEAFWFRNEIILHAYKFCFSILEYAYSDYYYMVEEEKREKDYNCKIIATDEKFVELFNDMKLYYNSFYLHFEKFVNHSKKL